MAKKSYTFTHVHNSIYYTSADVASDIERLTDALCKSACKNDPLTGVIGVQN